MDGFYIGTYGWFLHRNLHGLQVMFAKRIISIILSNWKPPIMACIN